MRDTKILREIMQTPKESDRTIAQRIGISQPTVTRHRHRLVTNNTITYEAIPDLKQLGYEIFAVTIFKGQAPENNNVVYAANVPEQGGIMVFSVHKNYSDYAKFVQGQDIHSSFLVAQKPMKLLSFKQIPLP